MSKYNQEAVGFGFENKRNSFTTDIEMSVSELLQAIKENSYMDSKGKQKIAFKQVYTKNSIKCKYVLFVDEDKAHRMNQLDVQQYNYKS